MLLFRHADTRGVLMIQGPKLKVLRPVVIPDAIAVMHPLARVQWPAELLGHY